MLFFKFAALISAGSTLEKGQHIIAVLAFLRYCLRALVDGYRSVAVILDII